MSRAGYERKWSVESYMRVKPSNCLYVEQRARKVRDQEWETKRRDQQLRDQIRLAVRDRANMAAKDGKKH